MPVQDLVGEVSRAASAVFGRAPVSVNSLHGGDLSEVSMVIFPGSLRVIAKSGPMVDREARMLAAIRETGASVPQVLAVSGRTMFLEDVSDIAPTAAWEALGHTLRRLHDSTGDACGWDENYAFGEVVIPNQCQSDWVEFWTEQRLMAAPEALPGDIALRVENLCMQLRDFLPRNPTPSHLHGDLWTGNVVFGRAGTAYLIDPACYYGHREVDLAMLHLFGSPGRGFQEAYGACEPGWEVRRAIYQLWPALVHLRLFGPGYRPLVESRLAAVGA